MYFTHSKKLRTLLLLFISCFMVRADLPVHCLKNQIAGKWLVLMEAPQLKGMGPLPCGHSIPDEKETSYKAYSDRFQESTKFDIILQPDNSVIDAQKFLKKGSWTMVYDEGFEFSYENTKYFAFSKYSIEGSSSNSYCDETLVGWYNNLNTGDRGCYKARKAEKVAPQPIGLDFIVNIVNH